MGNEIKQAACQTAEIEEESEKTCPCSIKLVLLPPISQVLSVARELLGFQVAPPCFHASRQAVNRWFSAGWKRRRESAVYTRARDEFRREPESRPELGWFCC